jgi:cold shock CspA family protein
MMTGTVRWFSPIVGAGFIRTDNGENVLFLKSAIEKSDPGMIREGTRVHVELLESPDGFTATLVKADRMTG